MCIVYIMRYLPYVCFFFLSPWPMDWHFPAPGAPVLPSAPLELPSVSARLPPRPLAAPSLPAALRADVAFRKGLRLDIYPGKFRQLKSSSSSFFVP